MRIFKKLRNEKYTFTGFQIICGTLFVIVLLGASLLYIYYLSLQICELQEISKLTMNSLKILSTDLSEIDNKISLLSSENLEIINANKKAGLRVREDSFILVIAGAVVFVAGTLLFFLK